MKVLLISANTESINMIPLPLGLNCVAVAARNAGHSVHLLDLMGSDDYQGQLHEAIGQYKPDLIGISVRNIDNQNMIETKFLLEPVKEVIAHCRTMSDSPIVVGGAGFSIFPRATLDYLGADMGICGEGEIALVALLHSMESGAPPLGIPGLCLRNGAANCASSREHLKLLPLPDPTLWSAPPSMHDEIWIPVQSRRGCPMQCVYCSTPMLEGTAIRMHPVHDMVDCIARHTELGYRRFYFVDNTFNFPPDYAKELCRALADTHPGVEWRCILYPGKIDEELVRLMARAGCVEVSLGFESGSSKILENLHKKYTLDQVRKASCLLKSYGIQRMGFLLLGGPGETKETVMESLCFADSLELDMLKLTIGIRIYPGTILSDIAVREGIIDKTNELLTPRFYIAHGIKEWILPTLQTWMRNRPYCIM